MKQTNKVNNNVFFDLVKISLYEKTQVKFRLVGNSMWPFLFQGDKIVVKRVSKISLGDIVLGRWNDQYILHRVIRRQPGKLFLAGDNNLGQVEMILLEDVVAVVVEACRKGKPIFGRSAGDRFLGLLWYYLRPIRIIIHRVGYVFKK